MNSRKWDLLDAIQGAYIGATLFGLYESGFLNELTNNVVYYRSEEASQNSNNENDNNSTSIFPNMTNMRTLATKYNYNLQLLLQLLDFMYLSTDIIIKRKDDDTTYYELNEKYNTYGTFGHSIDKLMGCYMPCLLNLDQTLKSPSLGADLINEGKLTTAFDRLNRPDSIVSELSAFLSTSALDNLVVGDLGCGPGSLLCAIAAQIPEFSGWGLDISETMCQAARVNIENLKYTNRLEIFLGDARKLPDILPENLINNTTVLFGGSILNEFFKDGNEGVIEFLKMIKNTFPCKDLRFVVMDYHGKLTFVDRMDKTNQHTIIHDVAQAVSGQGIPCPNTAQWREVYQQSGWKLAERIDYHGNGMDSFLHVLTKLDATIS